MLIKMLDQFELMLRTTSDAMQNVPNLRAAFG